MLDKEVLSKITIETIQKSWDEDCIIDDNYLDTESVKTAKLHAKYISLLITAKLKLSKAKADHNVLRKTKFRYYRGELSREELLKLGWEQYNLIKPMKNEMDEILKGDSDITNLDLSIDYLSAMIYQLESIMKSIADRTWSIGNSVKYKQFMAGN